MDAVYVFKSYLCSLLADFIEEQSHPCVDTPPPPNAEVDIAIVTEHNCGGRGYFLWLCHWKSYEKKVPLMDDLINRGRNWHDYSRNEFA